MIHLRDGASTIAIAVVRIHETAGVSVVNTARLREASGVSVFHTASGAGSFQVYAAPLTPYGAAATNAAATITTEIVSVTASEGVEPYTFTWSQVAPDAAWTITVVASGQAKFTRSGVIADNTYSSDFMCKVTDAAGRKVDTATITATVTNYGRISNPYL